MTFLNDAFKAKPHYKQVVLDNHFEDFIDKCVPRVREFQYLAFKHRLKCGRREIDTFLVELIKARVEHLFQKLAE